MSEYKHTSISNVNPHLICILCSGYLIDATTIVECLHTFCKSCIVRYFESSKFCPVCDVQVHKTDPLLSIRPDSVLQKLVYKLAPKIHNNEMLRRKKFYATNTKFRPVSLDDAGCDINRKYVLPEDVVCLALKSVSQNDEWNEDGHTRYFKCQANISILQLIKLIKGKFDLPEEHPVSVYADQNELLPDCISLVDVACMKGWQRKQLMTLYYKIYFSKKIKFDHAISLRPGRVERNKQLSKSQPVIKQESKPVLIEPMPKKLLPKIAPAPSRNPNKESIRLPPSSCANAFNGTTTVKTEFALSSYKTLLPLNTNTADIVALNPYAISQTEPLTNSYGLSVLPLCAPTIPTLLSNNLLNSFTLSGTVLPMSIPLGTNLFCPSMTNPVINQNITNIDLSSVPISSDIKMPPMQSNLQTSVVNAVNSLPISSIMKTTEESKKCIPEPRIKDEPEWPQDRVVHLTISETGIASFKSDGPTSDVEALINPMEQEACELLSQIETSHLIDSEDSKESDAPDGCSKLSEIKQEISLIIDNLMEKTTKETIDNQAQQCQRSVLTDVKKVVSIDEEGSITTLSNTSSSTVNCISPTIPSDFHSNITVNDEKPSKRKVERVIPQKIDSGSVVKTILSEKPVDVQKAMNKIQPKILASGRKSQAVGYRTLKCSPRSWYPVIPKDQILKNSTQDRTTNKFFKSRNTSLNTSNSPPKAISNPIRNILTSDINVGSQPLMSLDHKTSKEELLKVTQAAEVPRPLARIGSNGNENNPVITNNSPLKSNTCNHMLLVDDAERIPSNNNNNIKTCCMEDSISCKKLPSIKETDIKSQIYASKINDSKTDRLSKMPPSKIDDRQKSRTKPYEENKRKSSMPKKTIRVQSQNSVTPGNNSLEKIRLTPPVKGSPNSVEIGSPTVNTGPSVDSYKDIHTLQALSSLFPTASLKEAYQACLPLNLTNGFEKFGFNKSFPPTDVTKSAPYLSGLCNNMFQNLLLQANSMSAQNTLSLLASQENLTSNLLNMNFSNSPFLNNSYIDLPGTSSQPLTTDGNLIASWLRSQENRHSLLSSPASLSPSSSVVTTPSATISPVLKYSSDTKNKHIPVGMKDKVFPKTSKPTPKDDLSSPRTLQNCSTSSSKSSPTAITQRKIMSTNSIAFSTGESRLKQTPIKTSKVSTSENNNNPKDANLNSVRQIKSFELPKKTDISKPFDVKSKVDSCVSNAKKTPSQCHTYKSSLCHESVPATNVDTSKPIDSPAVHIAQKSIIPIESSLTSCTIESSGSLNDSVKSKTLDTGLPPEEKHTVSQSISIPPMASITTDTVASEEIKCPELDTSIQSNLDLVSEVVNDKSATIKKCSEVNITSNYSKDAISPDSKASLSNSKNAISPDSKAVVNNSDNTISSLNVKVNESKIPIKESGNSESSALHTTDSQKSTNITFALPNSDAIISSPLIIPIVSASISFESDASKENVSLDRELEPIESLVSEIPINLPVCSTPKKVSEFSSVSSVNDGISELKHSISLDTIKDIENESFSSSETSLRLVMDEGVFGTADAPSPGLKSNNCDTPTSLEIPDAKLSCDDLSLSLPTPSNFLIDAPLTGLIDQTPEDCFRFPKTAQLTSNKVSPPAVSTLTSQSSQYVPAILLNEQCSKKVNETEAASLSKNSPTLTNPYNQRPTTEQKEVTLPNQKPDSKVQEAASKSLPKNQTMSNYSSTDEFLQQLQSMTFPQPCNSQRPNSSQQEGWSNNFLTSNNQAAYDYACQKPYTTDAQTTCNQQYGFRNSTASSKTSSPRSQFSYNTYEQQKVLCSESSNVKKTNTSQDNYSAMQAQSAANHKYNYPLHPFSNCGYNSNYANFFGNNNTQSSNLSSLMSSAGYNFNFSNPKMFSGQQSYFSLNQASANNYISGTYGNNSGSNYQNSMNQYGFSNSNVNSNFGNNFGGSFSNFHFPYYNYNSYSHLYQGDNVGLISHHPSSLMSSFPMSSKGSLSPRNTNTPQALNDLSLQSSLFPVVPFVSGLQGSSGNTGSAVGTNQGSGTNPPKYSPRNSTTQKSNQKSTSKSRKGNSQVSKTSSAKTKAASVDQKSSEHFTAVGAMPCTSTYNNSSVTPRAEVGKAKTHSYGPPFDHLKTVDGNLDKSGHQMSQKPHYNMDQRNPASMYPDSGNGLLFDPAASSTPKPNNKQQFPTDFSAIGGMYPYMNPNFNPENFH